MRNERLFCVFELVAAYPLMEQPAHGVVRHHPAVELLAHQLRCFAAQHPPTSAQVRLHLVEHRLDLPALVVQPGQRRVPAPGASWLRNELSGNKV